MDSGDFKGFAAVELSNKFLANMHIIFVCFYVIILNIVTKINVIIF